MNTEPPTDAPGILTPLATWPSALHPAEPVDPNYWAPPLAHGDLAEELPDPIRLRRRWRLAPRSLTGRLVVGVVSLVVILVLATGIGTYYSLRSFLLDRLDQQVNATARSGAIHQLLSPRDPGGFGLQIPQTVWVEVLDKSGNPTSFQPSGPEVTPLTLSASDRRQLVSGTRKPVSRVTANHDHVRLVSIATGELQTLNTQTGALAVEPVTILIGLSEGEVDRTLHRLVVLELAIGASAVVLAFGATTYGVRYSLRRLYRVTRTAQEVAADLSPDGTGLDRRVPVEDADTTEVGQLGESMNTLLSAVETQFAARLAREEQMRQFLADASHELRTPLTSIRGYAELARMQRAHGEPTVLADNLARIESEGTRMSRLVDDLLTLARTDQGNAPRSEWIDVSELLEEAVSGVRAAHPARRIDVVAAVSLNIIGDRDQLLRVVRNLVTNAAVHTRVHGPIEVSAARESEFLVLRVADHGPGLPPEEAAHVFERFWRADKARTRSSGGTGLGLAIVASAVRAHGGSVRFDSTVEGGSTVTAYLPLGTG